MENFFKIVRPLTSHIEASFHEKIETLMFYIKKFFFTLRTYKQASKQTNNLFLMNSFLREREYGNRDQLIIA